MFPSYMASFGQRLISCILVVSLAFGPSTGYAQSALSALPQPGQMIGTTPAFTPPILKGMVIHPEDPLKFDFLMDTGTARVAGEDLRVEADKSIKYFLSALTVPEENMWVNLSPVEKDRVIPDEFGKTVMGRDLLGQDYILKGLASSLLYPESDLGKEFWTKIYQISRRELGTTDIDMSEFNRVWIEPDTAQIWENDGKAVILKSHLKVMLETDYKAQATSHKAHNASCAGALCPVPGASDSSELTKQVFRSVILPVLEKEINEGAHFAPLRQIYSAMILSAWYKIRLKESLLARAYADKSKVFGIEFQDGLNKDAIYARYLETVKKGVFNYIKEEPVTSDVRRQTSDELVPRRYFSGGFNSAMMSQVVSAGLMIAALSGLSPEARAQADAAARSQGEMVRVAAGVQDVGPQADPAYLADAGQGIVSSEGSDEDSQSVMAKDEPQAKAEFAMTSQGKVTTWVAIAGFAAAALFYSDKAKDWAKNSFNMSQPAGNIRGSMEGTIHSKFRDRGLEMVIAGERWGSVPMDDNHYVQFVIKNISRDVMPFSTAVATGYDAQGTPRTVSVAQFVDNGRGGAGLTIAHYPYQQAPVNISGPTIALPVGETLPLTALIGRGSVTRVRVVIKRTDGTDSVFVVNDVDELLGLKKGEKAMANAPAENAEEAMGLQETSLALVANVPEPAMVSAVVEWIGRHPVLTVTGTLVSIMVVRGKVISWMRKNYAPWVAAEALIKQGVSAAYWDFISTEHVRKAARLIAQNRSFQVVGLDKHIPEEVIREGYMGDNGSVDGAYNNFENIYTREAHDVPDGIEITESAMSEEESAREAERAMGLGKLVSGLIAAGIGYTLLSITVAITPPGKTQQEASAEFLQQGMRNVLVLRPGVTEEGREKVKGLMQFSGIIWIAVGATLFLYGIVPDRESAMGKDSAVKTSESAMLGLDWILFRYKNSSELSWQIEMYVKKQSRKNLIELARHYHPDVSREAIDKLIKDRDQDALLKIGSPAVPRLLGSLEGHYGNGKYFPDYIREAMAFLARTLQQLSWTPQTVEEKILFLTGLQEWDSLVSLGVPAVQALAGVGQWERVYSLGRDVMPVLAQNQYWNALRHFGSDAVSLLIRYERWSDLVRVGSAAVSALAVRMIEAESEQNFDVYNSCADALFKLGDDRGTYRYEYFEGDWVETQSAVAESYHEEMVNNYDWTSASPMLIGNGDGQPAQGYFKTRYWAKQHRTSGEQVKRVDLEPGKIQNESAMAKDEPKVKAESAMKDLGGIDLDARKLDLQIKRDEKGVALPVSDQPWETINIQGFIPVIYRIEPVNMPLLLGLNSVDVKGAPVSAELQKEFSVAREPEPLEV